MTLFGTIREICGQIQTVSNLFWNFPTNLNWYSQIPILGRLSLAVILLTGSGIFFTLRLKFVQVRRFGYGLKKLVNAGKTTVGISPLAGFLLSTAMRVGPGNILGVTGAISTGGPGALFWMWISAFFGMATAFVESTLSQIFKEKRGDEYVGGLPYYGRRLAGKRAGEALSILYIIYALLCFPTLGFNSISSAGSLAGQLSGTSIPTDSVFYWVCFAALIAFTAIIAFGGIRKVTRMTDVMVPVMAVVYVGVVLVLICTNPERIPWFFKTVFSGAFKPEAIFGGAFGIALQQGIKRGLTSNEAGQGTITMAAASAYAKHPCDQGSVQSVGVFLDTMVISTLTGFIIIMGRQWIGDGGAAWMELDKFPMFLASASSLAGSGQWLVSLLVTLCILLFSYTCLLGFISFAEICAKRISSGKTFINILRILELCIISFGIVTAIAGLDLTSLWNLSDLANILMVFCNIPLLMLGWKYVKRAFDHFEKQDGTPFNSNVAKTDIPVWDEKD